MGLELVLEPRAVRLYEVHVLATGDNYLDVELHCSKGYYVRALARDLGAGLGCPAHLGKLRRVRNGSFGLDLAAAWPSSSPVPLMPILEAVKQAMPTAQLAETGVRRARCGQVLTVDDFLGLPEAFVQRSLFAWLSGSELIALGESFDDGTFRVKRGFAAESQA